VTKTVWKTKWLSYTNKNKLEIGEDSDGIWIDYCNATDTIDVPIELARDFVERCKRGVPWECLLAAAIMQLARTQPEKFPCSVKTVYVIGRSAYIFTHKPVGKRSSERYRALRFEHRFDGTLRKYDTYTMPQFLKEFEGKTKIVRLRPPRPPGPPSLSGVKSRSSVPRISRGAQRRFEDAGIVPRVPWL
jgi:hypothetical protein